MESARQEFNDVLLSTVVEQLNMLYKSVPDDFYKRVDEEFDFIRNNDQLSEIEVIKELRDLAAKHSLPLLLNGTASGSLIFYLLGISNFNPMPAHYACRDCNSFEWGKGSGFGIDLPDKLCPECGEKMHKDGFNVPVESIWFNGEGKLNFDFLSAPLFIELAEKLLKNLYGWDKVYKSGSLIEQADGYTTFLEPDGFYILRDSAIISEFIEYKKELPDGRICLAVPGYKYEGKAQKIYIKAAEELEEIRWLSEATFELPNHLHLDDGRALGIINDRTLKKLPFISTLFIEEYIKRRGPVNVELLTKLYSAENSSYTANFEAEEYLINNTGDITKYLFDREDAFDILRHYGVDSESAYQVASSIRKGRGRDSFQHKHINVQVPGWLYDIADHIKYLYPRAHSISRIIVALQAAEYKVNHPYEYNKYHETDQYRYRL